MGSLLNTASQQDSSHLLVEAICEASDAERVASCINTECISDPYSFGYLMGRIASLTPKKWKRRLEHGLDERSLKHAVANVTLYSVGFASDGMHGWAVGEAGKIIATVNRGASWSSQNSGVTTALSKVRASSDGKQRKRYPMVVCAQVAGSMAAPEMSMATSSGCNVPGGAGDKLGRPLP